MSQPNNYEYDDKTRIITIYTNGVYSIGPKGEEILLMIKVGEDVRADDEPSGT